jgi:ABC-2 type transport system permease protein
MSISHSGTVFDIGYRSYTGPREGSDRSRRAVYKDGVRIALGIGRGGKAKILPWFFITVLMLIGLVMALVAGASRRVLGEDMTQTLNLPSHGQYYAIAVMVMFVFASMVAPELLCRDKREGVMSLYLVRPLTGSDYILSRWSAFLSIMLASAWIPQLILFLGLSMGDPAPLTYLKQHWMDVPRFLTAGFIMAAYITTLALLAASFTTRRAYAAVFLVGLFVISTPFTLGLAQELDAPVGQWVSMFNLTNIPLHVTDIIFDDTSDLTKEAPARELGSTIIVMWYLLWTLLPAGILWSRYRRMSP